MLDGGRLFETVRVDTAQQVLLQVHRVERFVDFRPLGDGELSVLILLFLHEFFHTAIIIRVVESSFSRHAEESLRRRASEKINRLGQSRVRLSPPTHRARRIPPFLSFPSSPTRARPPRARPPPPRFPIEIDRRSGVNRPSSSCPSPRVLVGPSRVAREPSHRARASPFARANFSHHRVASTIASRVVAVVVVAPSARAHPRSARDGPARGCAAMRPNPDPNRREATRGDRDGTRETGREARRRTLVRCGERSKGAGRAYKTRLCRARRRRRRAR